MADQSDKQSSRIAVILKELRQEGSVSVEFLRDKLLVSLATVRRDLQQLENRGLLRRTHGGAVPIEPLFYEAFGTTVHFRIKSGVFQKRRAALHRQPRSLFLRETQSRLLREPRQPRSFGG